MKIPGHLWQADHSLDRLLLEVRFDTPGEVFLSAHGRSNTAAKDLWRYSELFDGTPNDLSAGDAIHHLALAVLQDRPRTEHLLALALRGGTIWSEEELPL